MDISLAREPAADSAVQPHFRRGLFLLRQAHDYAVELKRSSWDFAVEISSLQEAGLTNSDLRWLVCKGYALFGQEVTTVESTEREYQRGGPTTYSDRTCFVLSETGVRLARSLSKDTPSSTHGQGDGRLLLSVAQDAPPSSNGGEPDPSLAPRWDRDRHEFSVGGRLVKVFKLPSPNQEAVLMAFEEEDWPARIDDPLRRDPNIDPKRRLHDTIKGLNRNQKRHLIRFIGDGTGEGVGWELIAAQS